ncbi:MAG: YARHG domain-containing protein [Lachnospiraceae bacterium]|nr:YARHG domain-containing protein [Lachnospiraceae bacterium]
MFCTKCGAQIPEGNRFCTKCGSPVAVPEAPKEEKTDAEALKPEKDAIAVEPETDEIPAMTEQTYEPETDETREIPQQSQPYVSPVSPVNNKPVKEKKSGKGLIVGIIAGLVVLGLLTAGIVILLGLRKTEVNLAEYLEVECEGYNGFGRVEAHFDTDKFVKDYKDKIKPNKNIKSLVKEYDDLDELADSADIKFSKGKDVARLFAMIYAANGAFEENDKLTSESLENGDILIYKWNFETKEMNEDEALEFAKKAFNVKLVTSDVEVEVNDLEDIEVFDAFKDLEVEFNGMSPNANANISRYPSDTNLDYSISNNSGLSNGDKVTVTASYYGGEEEYAKQYKRIPESTVKEFTVEGLDEYITDVSSIKAEDLEPVKSICRDKIISEVADRRDDYLSVESVNFDSAYLLTAKRSDSYNVNKLIMIEKVTIKCDSDKQKTEYFSYYTYYGFNNVVKTGSGDMLVDNVSDYGNDWTNFEYDPDNRGWTNTVSLRGYENFDRLFNDAFTRNVDEYKYEQIDVPSESGSSSAPKADLFSDIANEAEEGTGDYIFANSSIDALSKSDLEGLSADECRYARNEIYARHGRMFDDEDLQAYFNSKDWYQGTVKPKDFNESVLSQVEKDNIKLITDYEKKQGYR